MPIMRVLHYFNSYRSPINGESVVVAQIVALLAARGIETELRQTCSSAVQRSWSARISAGIQTTFNPYVYRSTVKSLSVRRPDVVHAHNLYPLFSPSVLAACHHAGVPTILMPHSFYLTCPVYTHLRDNEPCLTCVTGYGLSALRYNCRGNIAESALYALRSALTRALRLFVRNTSLVVALSSFAARLLESAGFEQRRIVVLPNSVSVPVSPTSPSRGAYVAFAGRLTYSKGVDTLLAAAGSTGIPVRIAGNLSMTEIDLANVPRNVTFVGELGRDELHRFYRSARFVVFPSRWFEMCPMVVLEAMSHGLPILAGNIGAVPELVQDGKTGMLFEPGNAQSLAHGMETLWGQPADCDRLGCEGRRRVEQEFNERNYVDRLLDVYRRGIRLGYTS